VCSSDLVPTANLTAITGTVLLTCQSNRFIDNSSNNFAVTSGTVSTALPSVQSFNPFSPSASYSPSVIGGSGYFDGDDYLSLSASSALNQSGDLTIEGWVNLSATPSVIVPIYGFENVNFLKVGFNSSRQVTVDQSQVGTKVTGTTAVPLGTWNHIALVRSGSSSNNCKIYLNGVQEGQFTDTSTSTVSGTGYIFRRSDNTNTVAGYLSNLRVTNTAVYTSAFTPSTTPLTAVTGTTLLTNFTNGAIFDNAMMNNLETVGNAQISTAVSKFGGGSMAFDGTDDRLVQNSSPQIAFGTGDFTVEAWIYSLDVSSAIQRGWLQTSSTAGGLATGFSDGVTFVFGTPNGNGTINAIVGGTNYASSGGAVSLSTWTHIAVTRASGAVKLFVNGTSVASGTGNTANLSGQFICIGGYYSTAYLYNGYIDDLRITNGYARYTSNFTPPTAAFPTF
jgi:hypothetical protein